jgi:adenylate kinase family enzyme
MFKRILIVGDSGRGKTTLAKNLSAKFSIPSYDTDDFFWKTKYTEPANREQSVIEINKIYDKPEWIMSGSTRHLVEYGLEKAEVVFYLKFKNIFFQYYSIIKRSLARNEEKLVDLWNLLTHITKKKYKKGYGTHMPSIEEMTEKYNKKVIVFYSYREINSYLKSVN